MLQNRILFIDVDGVLLDFNAAYAKHYDSVFGTNHSDNRGKGYNYLEQYNIPILDKENLHKLIKARDYKFWSTMSPMKGAKILLQELKVKYGFFIVALSAAPKEFASARGENLEELFGGLIDLSICAGDTPKWDIINGFYTSSRFNYAKHLVIDDHIAPVVGVSRAVAKVIILDNFFSSPTNANAAFLKTNTIPEHINIITSTLVDSIDAYRIMGAVDDLTEDTDSYYDEEE